MQSRPSAVIASLWFSLSGMVSPAREMVFLEGIGGKEVQEMDARSEPSSVYGNIDGI